MTTRTTVKTRLRVETLEDRWVPVNPVNSLPGTQNVAIGGTLAFSAANGNGLSFTDPDGPGPYEVEVSIRNTATNLADAGTVAAGTTAGLTVTGNGTTDLQIIGDQVDVLAALDSIVYTPAAGFSGQARLVLETDDQDGPGGLSDTDLVNINVVPPALTPSVTDATTTVGAQTTSGLVISRNAGNGAEVTHFKITNVQNGTLFLNNGTTPVASGTFVTFAQGNAGLRFTPDAGFTGQGSFDVQASLSNTNAGLGGGVATATVTVSGETDLAVTIAADAAVLAGAPLAYTITLTNVGPATVPAATLVLTLPPLGGVTFAPSAGGYDAATGAWTGLNLAAGASATLTFTGTVSAAATGTLTAVVTAFPPLGFSDPNVPNNVAAATTTVTPPPPAPTDLFAVGSGPGIPATVEVFNADGTKRFTLRPYGDFTGGVAVGTGDLTGDGIDDIVTGAWPGGAPHVKVFDGATGAEIRSFFAYADSQRGGVFVGLGDVTGDGRIDVVTGAGFGGAPHVKVFDGATGAEVRSFFAFDPNFRGGVTVRAGDIDGDGFADLVTGAGPGAGPHVQVFSGTDLTLLDSFFVFDPAFTGGVFVGVANLVGDARAEVLASANGRVLTRGYVEQDNLVRGYIEQDNLIPLRPGTPTGIAAVRTPDGIIAILIGAAPGAGGPHVKIIDGASNTVRNSFFAFDPAFAGGVFVG
jgi:hypothetical protein